MCRKPESRMKHKTILMCIARESHSINKTQSVFQPSPAIFPKTKSGAAQ